MLYEVITIVCLFNESNRSEGEPPFTNLSMYDSTGLHSLFGHIVYPVITSYSIHYTKLYDGVEVSREDELKIEQIFLEKGWIKNPQKLGKTEQEENAIEAYIEGILSHIDSEKIRSRKFKVVLDLGNGVQSVSAPLFCKKVLCDTILINDKIDGSFPGRGSEPTPQNLQELSSTVINQKADLGIAFDGDGDRSIFCDNNGEILTGDKSALVLTKHILNKIPSYNFV